ncbi:MAG: MFS transporter, partial [Chloroflexi bacterium]|nr:MFS transporter [Chloroflexota bacterium]
MINLILATRAVRMFAYGLLAVVFALYLTAIGLDTAQIGLLITLTLVGDAVVSLFITTRADQIGRKRMLIAGTWLMFAAGLAFLLTQNFIVLVITATLGIISLSNGEYGPFMSVEQAALSQLVPSAQRTALFARYQLFGSFASALGSLISGWLAQWLQQSGVSVVDSYRVPLMMYAVLGLVLGGMYYFLTSEIEAVRPPPSP